MIVYMNFSDILFLLLYPRRCRIAQYCCAKCQAEDWPSHKKTCDKIVTEQKRDKAVAQS